MLSKHLTALELLFFEAALGHRPLYPLPQLKVLHTTITTVIIIINTMVPPPQLLPPSPPSLLRAPLRQSTRLCGHFAMARSSR
jgi:hypothetical protein